jgi:hypothetical protein
MMGGDMNKGLIIILVWLCNTLPLFAQPIESVNITNATQAMKVISLLGDLLNADTRQIVRKLRKVDSVHFDELYKHIRFMINNSYQYTSINEKVKKVGSEMYLQQYQALFIRILLTTKVIELNSDTLWLYFNEYDELTDFSISLHQKSKINVNHIHIMPTEIHRQDLEQQGLLLTITEK